MALPQISPEALDLIFAPEIGAHFSARALNTVAGIGAAERHIRGGQLAPGERQRISSARTNMYERLMLLLSGGCKVEHGEPHVANLGQ